MRTDLFLARVRAALAAWAPHADGRSTQCADPGALALPFPFVPPRADLPHRREEVLELLTRRLAAVGAEPHHVATRQEARREICRLLHERGARVACPPCLRWPGIDDLWTGEVRQAEAGLVEAACAVADTGTVLLRHGGEQGRAYSLVPPASLVLAPASSAVASLGEAIARVCDPAGRPPVCATFVTGVSHSADIACVPCRGVHGPKEVHVWIIGDE